MPWIHSSCSDRIHHRGPFTIKFQRWQEMPLVGDFECLEICNCWIRDWRNSPLIVSISISRLRSLCCPTILPSPIQMFSPAVFPPCTTGSVVPGHSPTGGNTWNMATNEDKLPPLISLYCDKTGQSVDIWSRVGTVKDVNQNGRFYRKLISSIWLCW